MEPKQQNEEGKGGKGSNTGNGSSGSDNGFLCRLSSTRWRPSEQIRILKELYYNNGVRSPTTEQIHKISARLRQYDKIEGKNVFYWFQNHQARERQKKRLITNNNPIIANTTTRAHNLHVNNPIRAHNHLHHTTAWRSSDHYPNIYPDN